MPSERNTIAQIYQAANNCTSKEALNAADQICKTPEVRDQLLKLCTVHGSLTATGAVLTVSGVATAPTVAGAAAAGAGMVLFSDNFFKAKRFCNAYARHTKAFYKDNFTGSFNVPAQLNFNLRDTFLGEGDK